MAEWWDETQQTAAIIRGWRRFQTLNADGAPITTHWQKPERQQWRWLEIDHRRYQPPWVREELHRRMLEWCAEQEIRLASRFHPIPERLM